MSEILGFENFRIFKSETIIDLRSITVLTGPNSSGKSSIIKAAKLLKQNINSGRNTGLPVSLSYTPDELGHNLGDYNQTVNLFSQSSDLSFIIPIKLLTLGDDFNCKFTYGKMEDGIYPDEITLKSISIIHGTENPVRLIKIKGALGNFYDIEINPLLVKHHFEDIFLPLVDENIPKDSFAKVLAQIRKRDLPGQDILGDLLKSDQIYSKDKPILPWYMLFINDKELLYFSDKNHSSSSFQERYLKIIDYYTQKIEEFRLASNINSATDATIKYFMMLENEFFDFINKEKLNFPIDMSIDDRNTTWWNGIMLRDSYDKEIRTSDRTIQAILNFDPRLAELMEVYENSYSLDNYQEPCNHDIFTAYAQYVILQSIEECRIYIDKFRFADLNRIEQVLLFSNTNSLTAFKIINDFKKHENSQTKKTINYYLRVLNIAEEYNIIPGNGAYQINLLKQSKWVPIASQGFGISKLFFFLLTLSAYEMVFIEEPESNLHPDLQSRLADILLSFPNNNKIVIIETHSEYFIRKLQYLVATNKLKKENIIIQYFKSPADNNSLPIKKILINRDGSLEGEFGKGFFDEASNIIRDLFNLTVYN